MLALHQKRLETARMLYAIRAYHEGRGLVLPDDFEERFRGVQPRVPAGSPTGGQWLGNNHRDREEPRIEPASFSNRSRNPRAEAMRRMLQGAISIYNSLSQWNGPTQHAILEFRAREFGVAEDGTTVVAEPRMMSREEVVKVCTRLEEMETRTREAEHLVARERPDLRQPQYGTVVHKEIADRIRALEDPNFRAEVSRIKSRETDAAYGERGSVRMDSFQNIGNGTACIYDVKTGPSILTMPRMGEVAEAAVKMFGGLNRIIVAEVRAPE